MTIPKAFRSFLRYLSIGLVSLLGILVLFTGLVYYVAVSDQQRVPEIVEETCREQFGAEVTFSHYQFKYLDYFPFLSLSLEDVRLRDPARVDSIQHDLLRVKRLNVLFRPWKMLRKEFVVRSVFIEEAALKVFRSRDGYSNTAFLQTDSSMFFQESRDSNTLFSLDRVWIEDLSFDLTDSLRGKYHRFVMEETLINFRQTAKNNQLHITGGWLLRGLVFKEKNGPFFENRPAKADLNIAFNQDDKKIDLQPSRMVIDGIPFDLEGYLITGAPGYLALDIHNPALPFAATRELLAANLKRALGAYSMDQPLRMDFHLEGELKPNHPQAIKIDFYNEATTFATNTLRFTEATFEGRYFNNCDSAEVITPHTDCLTFEHFAGKLFDTIPVSMSYRAHDMKNPDIEVQGSTEVALSNLRPFLPTDQFRVNGGALEASFNFAGRPKDLVDSTIRKLHMQLNGRANLRDADITYLPNNLRLRGLNSQIEFDESDLRVQDFRFTLAGEPYTLNGKLNDLIPYLFEKDSRLWAYFDLRARQVKADQFFSGPGNATFASNSPRDTSRERIAAGDRVAGLVRNITETLPLSLRVRSERLEYRKLGVSQVDFRLRVLNQCRQQGGGRGECLVIDRLKARIYDDIPLEARLKVTDLDDPLVDMAIDLEAPFSQLNRFLPADKLRLEGGKLTLQLDYQGRLNDYFDLEKAALNAKMEGAVKIRDAAALYLPDNYRVEQLHGDLHFDRRDLFLDSLWTTLNQNELRVEGAIKRFMPFLFDPNPKLVAALQITTPLLDLNRFELERQRPKPRAEKSVAPISQTVSALIAKLEGQLSVQAEELRYQDFDMTDVAFKSRIREACEQSDHRGGCVHFEQFRAKIYGDAPFEADMMVWNLRDPIFELDGEVEMPLIELNRLFSPDQFRFKSGLFKLDFHYRGQPHNHFDPENALLKARFEGAATIQNGALNYQPRDYQFRKLSGKFEFDEKDLRISSANFMLNGNPLRVEGVFYEFMPFLFLPDRTLNASLKLKSSHFDFFPFKVPRNLPRPAKAPMDNSVASTVNAALNNIAADLEIDFDKISFRQFRAFDVRGDLKMMPDRVQFDSARMRLADGAFLLDGEISNIAQDAPRINIEADFRQTEIDQIFRAFDNFGQSDLTADNIKGALTADIDFKATANSAYELTPSSLAGNFDIKVEDGELIRLPALMNLNGFLFKNRDMEDIRFATLENRFRLEGQDLYVDHFYVLSSAFTFGVEGTYCLGPGGHTDLLFEVPITNIFKRDFNVESLEDLEDGPRGLSVLLRAIEEDSGKLNFKLVFSRKRD